MVVRRYRSHVLENSFKVVLRNWNVICLRVIYLFERFMGREG